MDKVNLFYNGTKEEFIAAGGEAKYKNIGPVFILGTPAIYFNGAWIECAALDSYYTKEEITNLLNKYLPLAGGTMSGALALPAGESVKWVNDSGKILGRVRTEEEDGAGWLLFEALYPDVLNTYFAIDGRNGVIKFHAPYIQNNVGYNFLTDNDANVGSQTYSELKINLGTAVTICTVSSGGNLSSTGILNNGCTATALIYNSGSSEITVNVITGNGWIGVDGNSSITIAAGCYGEVSVTNFGGTMAVRSIGGSSVAASGSN